MKSYVAINLLFVTAIVTVQASESTQDPPKSDKRDQRSIPGDYHAHHPLPPPQLISQHVDVEKQVSVVQNVPVPVPVPQHVPVPVQVPVPVDQPYPLHVPVRVPVYKTLSVPVEKPVAVPVEKQVPVELIRQIPVAVPKPYPVPISIYRTKHVYHEVIHSKNTDHEW